MAISSQTILASWVVSADGTVGAVHDLLFDADNWKVRYLTVDTGGWLPRRRVLLSPALVQEFDWLNHELTVGLSRQQIESSPAVEADASISRAGEIELARHYGWGAYWTGRAEAQPGTTNGLRSLKDVTAYAVAGRDGPVGSIADFIIDDRIGGAGTWEIRYVVVEVGGWLHHKRVLVAPAWAEQIDWESRKLHLSLPQRQVQESPDFDPGEPVNREDEQRLYDYYGLPKYWSTSE